MKKKRTNQTLNFFLGLIKNKSNMFSPLCLEVFFGSENISTDKLCLIWYSFVSIFEAIRNLHLSFLPFSSVFSIYGGFPLCQSLCY